MSARLELVDECRSLVRIRATTNPWMQPPQNAVAGRVVGRETHASSRLPAGGHRRGTVASMASAFAAKQSATCVGQPEGPGIAG
jgi:hypothetical protein